MAGELLDATALLEPVSADAPCGPDLDLAGDPDFLQATGRIEGTLPSSFFTQDDEGNLQPFDRSKIEIVPALKEIAKLLKETRDLRLLTLSSRLCALNRDMAGLASQFTAIAALLKDRWADVHPQADDGDFGLRMAILQTMDDAPTMALPLQYMTLLESRRLGQLNYRAIMIANGEMAAAGGETALDKSAIDRAFAEADLDQLKATHARVGAIRDAVDSIRTTTTEGAGYENAVGFDRVAPLVGKMVGAIETVLVARDPTATVSAAPPTGDGAAAEGPVEGVQVVFRPSGPIRDVAHAAAALVAAGGYLRRFEPSSPGEILVRQAQELVGKSFIDVMRALVPNFADEATIAIGADRAFQLSFGQLSALGENASDDGWASGDGEEEERPAAEEAPPPPAPKATNRREAVDLLRQVAGFYRMAEPSSPVPLLLDRACSLAESDFLTILRDVLPQIAKRDDE